MLLTSKFPNLKLLVTDTGSFGEVIDGEFKLDYAISTLAYRLGDASSEFVFYCISSFTTFVLIVGFSDISRFYLPTTLFDFSVAFFYKLILNFFMYYE